MSTYLILFNKKSFISYFLKFIWIYNVPNSHIKIGRKFLLSIGTWEYYIENWLGRGYRLGGGSPGGFLSRLWGHFLSYFGSWFRGCLESSYRDILGSGLVSYFGSRLGSWLGGWFILNFQLVTGDFRLLNYRNRTYIIKEYGLFLIIK